MMATTSKGENYTFAVLDDEDGKDDGIIDDDGTAFRHEKKFKLSVIQEDGGIVGEIEGCYLNVPLNAMIVGQYTDAEEIQSINFTVQRN